MEMMSKTNKKVTVCIYCLFICFAGKVVFSSEPEFLFFRQSEISGIKNAFDSGDEDIVALARKLKVLADSVLKTEPFSITFHHSPALSEDPHDYYSESPYWWPDPDNSDAPYIRRDGERNPDRFLAHKTALNAMYSSVFILSLAGYLWDNPCYCNHARHLIHTWFIDQETRMNPHLRYAQAIPNKSTGRGVGIIETRHLVKLIEAVHLLQATGTWDNKIDLSLKEWFSQYLNWLFKSPNGLDEKNQGNNHSSWWGVQVAAFSIFTGEGEMMSTVWDYYSDFLLPGQMLENGSFPEEEERTLSLSYSVFNLDALLYLCRLAELQGEDLWNFRTKSGTSLENAVEYITPYLLKPDQWKKEQIRPFSVQGPVYLAFAGLSGENRESLKTYLEYRRHGTEQKETAFRDPFIFLVDMVVINSLK